MKTELKAELLNKRGDFVDSKKNGRVSDEWMSALMLIDCETEADVIEIEVWHGRANYYCTITVKFGEFNLRSDARGSTANEAIRTAFKSMGVSWSFSNELSMEFLRSTDVEKVFVAIAQELGVKRPKTIRAGYQPIYQI